MDDILKELIDYSIQKKAELIYKKLLKNNKYDLAQKVKEKYSIIEKYSNNDDTVTAFSYALLSLKIK